MTRCVGNPPSSTTGALLGPERFAVRHIRHQPRPGRWAAPRFAAAASARCVRSCSPSLLLVVGLARFQPVPRPGRSARGQVKEAPPEGSCERDIVPHTPPLRAIAATEALAGQIIMTLLIGALVGVFHILKAYKSRKTTPEDRKAQ